MLTFFAINEVFDVLLTLQTLLSINAINVCDMTNGYGTQLVISKYLHDCSLNSLSLINYHYNLLGINNLISICIF